MEMFKDGDSQLPNTRDPLYNSAPLDDFENLIIVPGEIRNVPVEPHLPFLVPLGQFREFFKINHCFRLVRPRVLCIY